MRAVTAIVLFLLTAVSSTAAENRMSPELLWKHGRVGGGAVSPDGAQIAYSVRRYDLAKNSGLTEIHLISLSTGKDRIALTLPNASSLQWGQGATASQLFYVAAGSREDAKPQVWSFDASSNRGGAKPRQVKGLAHGHSLGVHCRRENGLDRKRTLFGLAESRRANYRFALVPPLERLARLCL